MVGMGNSRPGQDKQDRLMAHFASGSTARIAARLCGVNRKTGAFFPAPSVRSYEQASENETMFGGETGVDESYFGGKRKGKRGRGAAGKIPVFGIAKGWQDTPPVKLGEFLSRIFSAIYLRRFLMKNGRFSDAQMMGILKQGEGGVPVSGLCREHGMSRASFYNGVRSMAVWMLH